MTIERSLDTTVLNTTNYTFYHSAGRAVLCLLCLKDGTVLSGSMDKTVRRWTREGRLLQAFEGHTFAVSLLVEVEVRRSINEDTRQQRLQSLLFMSASWDGTVRLWNLCTGVCLSEITVLNREVKQLIQLKNVDPHFAGNDIVLVSSTTKDNWKEGVLCVWRLDPKTIEEHIQDRGTLKVTESSRNCIATIRTKSTGITELHHQLNIAPNNNKSVGFFLNCTSVALDIYTVEGQLTKTITMTPYVATEVFEGAPGKVVVWNAHNVYCFDIDSGQLERQSIMLEGEAKVILKSSGLIGGVSSLPRGMILKICNQKEVVYECRLGKPTCAVAIHSVIELSDNFIAAASADGRIDVWRLTQNRFQLFWLLLTGSD
eukprot:TRINITY_DN3121_c0_g1_i1.p1 TRINITY_DN3121_c0_g1~~TRINITY_DN3121_c0_g1_i1.p1  ORF type:complete len:428 (-),score=36.17 TRINITY_DN3121_c0_g1_i1:602-1717(-)